MDTEFQSNNIFSELSKTLNVIGEERLIAVLQNEREEVLKSNDPLVIFIFRVISDGMGISIDEIINSRAISGKRKYSIGFLIYYLSNDCNLSLGKLQPMFKKSRSLLSKYKTMISNIRPETTAERWLEKKAYFDMSINNFKLSLK